MRQENINKILRVYFEYPGKKFTVRTLASLTKIPRSSVQVLLNDLKKEKLLDKNNESIASIYFNIKKINYFIDEITKIGLIDYLVEELNPSLIILFGSFRKGESDKESDVDLFIESLVKKELDLGKFEKKLNHKIDLFVESNINNLREDVSFLVEDYYEIIKELLVAYLLKNGLKSQNHQCLISYFYKMHPELENEADLISHMSFFRNRMGYYGEEIPRDFYINNKGEFDKIIEILLNLVANNRKF